MVTFAPLPIPGEALVTLHRGLHPGLLIAGLVLVGIVVGALLAAAGLIVRIVRVDRHPKEQ